MLDLPENANPILRLSDCKPKKPEQERIFCRVRNYRWDRRISQRELCEDLGISRQTLVSMERDRHLPSLRIALKLAKYFGTTVEALFFSHKK